MKKINPLIALLLFLTTFSSSFGARAVVEVGQNVKVNALAKIEQTKNTLEAIQQTKNQIIQLKNDALNLNKWAGTILQETLGISQADINNLLEIQSISSELYNDARNFEKNWKKEFELDYTKLDIRQLGETHDKTFEKIQEFSKDLNRYSQQMKDDPSLKKLKKSVETFNRRNSQVTGNVDALQLNNEIMISLYSSINSIAAEEKARELAKNKKEMYEEENKKINEKFREERRKLEAERIPLEKSYDVYYF